LRKELYRKLISNFFVYSAMEEEMGSTSSNNLSKFLQELVRQRSLEQDLSTIMDLTKRRQIALSQPVKSGTAIWKYLPQPLNC